MTRLYIHVKFQVKADALFSHPGYCIAFMVYISKQFSCLNALSLRGFLIILYPECWILSFDKIPKVHACFFSY